MAFTSTLTTETDFDAKAGIGVSSSYTEAMKNAAVLRAESFCNDIARYNFTDAYSGLNVDTKHLLSDIVSSMVAIEAIAYDFSGYFSDREAENKINWLRDMLLKQVSILRDKKVQDFINKS